MTNQQGAPEALRPITRYEVVDCIDSKHVPAVIPNGAGPWVRYEDHLAALVEAQQPAPSAAAAGQRRSDLVPGVMHCAKCKFQLNRVTLCVSDGNAYAGNNETEPCPNGCGPLWPVTWEQEARNCWKALEEMHKRLHPAPTPQADSQPAPSDEAILSAARNWGEVQQYNRTDGKGTEHRIVFNVHHRAAHFASELLAGRAPANSQPAHQRDTGYPPLPECDATTVGLGAVWNRHSMRAYVDSDRAARATADSVLEDAAREVLMEHSGCGGGTQVDMLTVRLNPGDRVVMFKGRITQAVESAARKQGANHD